MGFPSKDIARKISPYAVMLLIISVSAYLWISDVKLRQNYLTSQTEKISQEVETVMKDQIQNRFDLLEDLALKWPMVDNESHLWNYKRFTRYVTPLYNMTGGFLAINFINISKIISWIYPYEDNIGALNKSINYTADGVFNYALDSAFKTGIYNYTGIIPFLQGGFGFASYFPVYFNNTLIGVINGVFSFDKLLTKLIQGSSRIIWLEDYSLKVYDANQSIFVSGFDFELTDHFVKSMPFILARIPLTLYLQPNLELRSQVSYFKNISIFILGILFGVIIGIFILLLERNFKKINQDMIEKSQMEQIIFRKQKFESLGTLAGGIAHDFNNILSGIQGNMELTIFDLDELTEKIKINPELLQNIGDLVKDSKENLHEIQELIQHSIEINRQITDFSSGSHSNIGLFNVRDLLNFSINSFSNMIDKRIKIDKNYFGLNPYIICDSSQFKQVILNILINARDAMVGRDGKIEISIATQKREHSLKLPKKIQTFVKNNKCELDHTLNLIISIKDSGEGIPPENLEKIFDPFFTSKRGEHGSGLGLAIVYKIIHSTGGDIIVNSTMGEGTTFDLILPYMSNPGEAPVKLSSFSEKKSQSIINCPNLKVLIIEDEEIIRKNLKKFLEAGKVFVFLLGNGEKGWNFYQEHKKELDLVILDINLPGMNGIDIYHHIKEVNPKQPTLFMTGYSAYDFPVFDKYDLGLLEKPFKFDELGHKIQEFYDSFKKSE